MSAHPVPLRRDARRAILDAAHALLRESGADGFTIRRLAARCGYAAPSIYHHFGDKTGLLDAVLEEVFQGLLSDLERGPAHEDPVARVRAQFATIVRFGLDNPVHYRLMTQVRPADAEPIPSAEVARAALERPLEELAAQGRLRADLEAVKQSLWVLLHGLIALPSSRPEHPWLPRLCETALDALLEGFVADAVRP